MPTTRVNEDAREIVTATLAELPTGELIRTRTFAARADQVAYARAFIRTHLADDPACDTVVLLVSELATNSIRHSRSRFFAVTLARIGPDRLRITVIDEGRAGIPYLPEITVDTEGGRGIAVIDCLATRWGITRLPDLGTAVWFECAGR